MTTLTVGDEEGGPHGLDATHAEPFNAALLSFPAS